MFKFGKKEKDKSKSDDKKKERKESKKEKKSKDSSSVSDEPDGDRYTPLKYPPPVAAKPSVKNGKPFKSRGILKTRSSKSKSDYNPVASANLDESQILQENTRINEEFSWRIPSHEVQKPVPVDRRKRESIHSITMNISPPNMPPPASAAEKVYGVNLELPTVTAPPSTSTRELTVSRQPKGDFGFNLRWAPYKDRVSGSVRQVVHAEPGSSGAKSGVITGDRIIEVNGKNVEYNTREDVIAMVQKSVEAVRLKVQQIAEVSELTQRSTENQTNQSDNKKTGPAIVNGLGGDGGEMYWLVHRGGYSSCQLIQPASPDVTRCKVKLDNGGHVLEVDENDLEKVNPAALNRCENLSSLKFLNESSLLHVLRQRYGSSLIHTVTGPSLLVINPDSAINVYSHKIMQMVKACRLSELPPHVYSQAQSVYQAMLNTSRDQSIVLSGRAGSGKTTSLRHILSFYAHCYGGVHSVSLDEKFTAACFVLESLGNCSTRRNKNATRFSQLVTVDFDSHGHVISTSFQVTMLEKPRIVKSINGESSFHIFNYVKHGVSTSISNELQLQGYSSGADEYVDKEAAAAGWAKLDQSLRVLAITADESKIIQQVVAAIVHIQNTGVSYGANNKAYFANPTGAQTACQLLGVSMEELSKAIFSPSANKATSRGADDNLPAGEDALEGFVIGLYTELFNMIVSLVNRSLSLSNRYHSSITIVDVPGFNDDSSHPSTFADLCYNYVNERMQLLFHEKTFTENQERYIQENIDVDHDDTMRSPLSMVSLMDKCSTQQQMQMTGSGSRVDLSLLGRDDESEMGLLWILDQHAMTRGATDRLFVEKLYEAHGNSIDQLERLLTLNPQQPTMITLNHCQGTSPVTYNTTGWMRDCRNHPSSERAISLLNSSQRSGVTDMFSSMTGSMIGSFTSASSRGTDTLRGLSTARRLIANQAGIKRRSQAILVKYQADSLIDSLCKTEVHFINHLVATGKVVLNTAVLDVPDVRVQIRALQLLPAIRYYRQGYPEHMAFGEFISRYSLLAGNVSTHAVALVDQKSVVEGILNSIEVDSSYYRIGLSQVFLRPAASAHLDHQRELRRTFYAVAIQNHIRRYLAQKTIAKLKLKHEAMRCLQKNIRIHFKLSGWQWWKLYTKIKPLVNVHQTEDDLKFKENELKELKLQLESLEAERTAYKKEFARFEDETLKYQTELAQERQVARQAVELLENETSNRLAVETQIQEYQVSSEFRRVRIAELETENDSLRHIHQDYDDTHSELTDASSVSLSKYEHMVKDQDMKRLELQSEHDNELETLEQSKHKMERQLRELMMDREEQVQQINNLKKKVQKYSNEAQDLKRQCEESDAHNAELEKKHRRVDNDLHQHAGDIAGERIMREHLQKERDQLLKQKYTLGQQLEDVTIERDALQSKLRRMEHEMTELRCAGTGDSELLDLRTAKHELERKLADSEDDIGDLQQEMHELEMVKLKLQLEVDKMKQKQQKELDQLEREMDELRETSTRKTRNYENRIAELDGELQSALQGRRDAERKLIETRDAEPVRDHEHEKELKLSIRRLRCLLTDSQGQLEKMKEQTNQKSQIRTLETKMEDLQANLTATLKSKHSMEVELLECQMQLSAVSKSRMEAEDKAAKLMREKTDIENEKEDLDEEIHELLKRYQALLSQNSVTAMALRDQSEQISSLAETKNRLQEELDSVNTKLAHIDSLYVTKDKVVILESKCLEIEQKMDYEKSLHIRYENQALKAKDQCEKLDDDISKMNAKLADEERRSRQIQSQLSRALESHEEVHRKDIEQTQTIANLTQRLEISDSEIRQLQVDLKSAHKRVENLQSTMMQSTLSDEEAEVQENRDEEFDSDSDDDY